MRDASAKRPGRRLGLRARRAAELAEGAVPGQIVRRGPVSVGAALTGFLRTSGLDKRLRQAGVLVAWSEALPAGFRAQAEPVRFQAGELVVEVRSAAHLHELRGFSGESVRARANERLAQRGSRERIERVVYKIGR